MIARRLGLVAFCALACLLVGGAGSAWAGGGSFLFGSQGEEAGQFGIRGSFGAGVDQVSGDVYFSDPYNNRVEKFDRSGEFLLSVGAGAVGRPGGVAVDQGTGDVYVVDFGNDRVQKFDPSGKFLLMFGGHVNKNGTDVCVAGEECQAGTEGAGDGEFSRVSDRANIAVGPGGQVYVGDEARVQVFEPSGVWKQNISLSGLSSEGKVTALAVNAAGDVFVKDEGVPGVREMEAPLFLESPVKFDEGSENIMSIALDAAGDLFVSDGSGILDGELLEGGSFKEYGPSGQQLEAFGGGSLLWMQAGMAFDEALGELLVFGTDEDTSEYGHSGVWGFAVPPPGPLVETGSEKATPELRGAATFEAMVSPEGSTTEVKFEYVDEKGFDASGYAGATSTAPVTIGSGFSEEHAEVHLPQMALVPGVRYHWRVVAHNSQGTSTGPDQSFLETPPSLVEGPWATSVTASSVTLEAEIDPLGANTSYRLEYGTSSSYGHVLSGSVGEGMGYVQVDYHLQGLEPLTVYHYRVVSESEVGIVEGADHTFTTEAVGGSLVLPDGRAWELVSPPDKGGALIENINAQAAADGSGIVYSASEPLGEGISGHVGNRGNTNDVATVLSRRTGSGWGTRDISAKQTLPPEGETGGQLFNISEVFHLFSPDLSMATFEPRRTVAAQSAEATELTPYLRNDVNETYEPLVTAGNVPSGTEFGPDEIKGRGEVRFAAATPDLTHVILESDAPLTPNAHPFEERDENVYEWSGGHLELVNILPDGVSVPGAELGSGEGSIAGMTAHAVSADGRWIVFRYGQVGTGIYYVRDMVEEKTVLLGRENGLTKFQSMSADGSKVFYIEPESSAKSGREEDEGELYVLDPATGVKTALTADHLDGEHNAGVQDTLVGTSEDGSYVYFVAKGVLASGASSGQYNLYLSHDVGGVWTTRFIATLSSEDEKDWFSAHGGNSYLELSWVTSRVSSNGRFVAFMSDRSLTGYDNRDALSGQPDEETYVYDATAERLVCASCNPTGARPVGVHERPPGLLGLLQGGPQGLVMDSTESWSGENDREFDANGHWVAGILPPAWHESGDVTSYQPRYLSDDGRLFFDSTDALVAQDTNGLADVYEYEPVGVGDCTSASVTFSERSAGCVGLISSGQSSSESVFFDASETGDDVFFITTSRLVSEDYDTAFDVYDAHVCSSAVPCRTVPVSPPACTSGDSCKAAPSPQPEIFGPAPSATFSGTGNVIVEAKKAVVKRKTKKPKRHVKHKKHKSKSKSKGKRARRSAAARTSGKGGE